MKSAVARRFSISLGITRWGMAVLTLVAIAALGTALLLAQISLVASAGYNAERLKERQSTLQRLNLQLEAEIAHLRSLDRIEREARTRLKMITPTSYVYITVDTLPQDPTPLLKKALREKEPSSATQSQPWWETLVRALLPFRSTS